MSKFIKFIPTTYMLLCMTLSMTLIQYLIGNVHNFWAAWAIGFCFAAPLAFFFSSFIGNFMKKIALHKPSEIAN